MKKSYQKQNVETTYKDLLAEYLLQSSSGEKHSYSEQLHNDDGSCCCLCDLIECGVDVLNCCSGA